MEASFNFQPSSLNQFGSPNSAPYSTFSFIQALGNSLNSQISSPMPLPGNPSYADVFSAGLGFGGDTAKWVGAATSSAQTLENLLGLSQGLSIVGNTVGSVASGFEIAQSVSSLNNTSGSWSRFGQAVGGAAGGLLSIQFAGEAAANFGLGLVAAGLAPEIGVGIAVAAFGLGLGVGVSWAAKQLGGLTGEGLWNVTHNVGGVLFNKAASLTGNIPRLSGAYWDSARGVLVLHGAARKSVDRDLTLPGVEHDNLVVAFRSALAGEPLGVSIDPPAEYRDGIARGTPPPDGTDMYVSYLGNTAGTFFGAIMFEADRVMKCLSNGVDNVSRRALRADKVEGYGSLLDLFKKHSTGAGGSWFRFWFVIDEVEVKYDEASSSLVFGEVKLKVLNETTLHDGVVAPQDPACADFVENLTERYEEYCEIFPVFRRLKEVAKISALARFLINEGVAMDQASIWAHPVLPLPTPSTTPGICVSGYGHRLFGGVDMGADPQVLTTTAPQARKTREAATAARPGIHMTAWEFIGPDGRSQAIQFRLRGASKPYRAISSSDHAFQAGWRDSVRSVRRVYNSNNASGDFGPGWQLFLPFRIDVIAPSRKQAAVLLKTEPADQTPSSIVVQNCINDDVILYRRDPDRDNAKEGLAYRPISVRSTSKKEGLRFGFKRGALIRFINERYFLTKDSNSYVFDANGRLERISIPDGLLVQYRWTGDLVDRIDCGGGCQYQVHYDKTLLRPRISSIVSSDGVTLTYAYDAAGRLCASSIDGITKASYRYDALSRLAETRNGAGLTVSRVAYEESGNQISEDDSIDTISDGTPVRKKLVGGRIVAVEDESGTVADFAYRAGGSLEAVTASKAGRRLWRLEYDEDGRLTDCVDEAGLQQTLAYASDERVSGVTTNRGSAIQFPDPTNKKRVITGSRPDGTTWVATLSRNGLPETIQSDRTPICTMKWRPEGMDSIRTPDGSCRIVRKNGAVEFLSKSVTGAKQTVSIDRTSGQVEIGISRPESHSQRYALDQDTFQIEDCAGIAKYRVNRDTLTCRVNLSPPT